MKVSTGSINVSKLQKMAEKKKLNFQLPVQRNGDIWDQERKSLLIHSVLTDFPVPAIYAVKEGRKLGFLDGRQRLESVLSYTQDEYEITAGTPEVGGQVIEKKKFSELSSDMQDIILNYSFLLNKIEDADVNDLEKIFFRLNNGVPLKPIELTRGILGSEMLTYIEEIANTPFFEGKINVSKKARQRYVDQELILQILSLVYNRNVGFSSNELKDFVKYLRNEDIQTAIKPKIQNVSYYLNEVYLTKQKYLKKIHIPSLFIVALENQENNVIVSPEEFREWSDNFFDNVPEIYTVATKSGSAKKENVQKRIQAMRSHHQQYFKERFVQSSEENTPLIEVENMAPELLEALNEELNLENKDRDHVGDFKKSLKEGKKVGKSS